VTAAARRAPALLVALLVLLSPGTALAHPALVETAPGAGYAVTSPPEEVAVTFNEPVTPVGEALVLRRADGSSVPLDVRAAQESMSLRGVPEGELEPGSYEVSYRVVALDGDLIEGTFAFGVATPVPAGSSAGGLSQDDPDQVQPGSAVPRALLFLGLALALGGLVGALLARRQTGERSAVRPLVRTGALLGLAGTAALLLQVASVDVSTWPGLLQTSQPARLLAAEAALFALALVIARAPLAGAVAAAALVGVVLLEGVRAHPNEAIGAVGWLLTVVHLAAAAVWVGGLVHVVRLALAWRGRSLATWMVVGAYSRVAIALFLVVLATGALSALLLLPTLQDWTGTTYGRVLLLKLAVLAGAAVAAVVARARHRHAVEHGAAVVEPKRRAPWVLSRAARWEAALLAVVLVLTAGLTSATPPRLVSQQALLPAPTGAVVRVAERVRQVSVAVAASAGTVELRAYAPGPQEAVEFALDVALVEPGGEKRELDLQDCGPGCWTAEVDWAEGVNLLRADVSASGWEGGETEIEVHWPPQPAIELLRTVQSVMGAQSRIRVAETVTSGFDAAPSSVSVRNGQQYLEDQPWSDGGVTDPHVFTEDGVRTLVFAMPVLAYHFEMTLDEQNRVVTERVVTRKHLIERRYAYPGGE
jgi:copper transport protein